MNTVERGIVGSIVWFSLLVFCFGLIVHEILVCQEHRATEIELQWVASNHGIENP